MPSTTAKTPRTKKPRAKTPRAKTPRAKTPRTKTPKTKTKTTTRTTKPVKVFISKSDKPDKKMKAVFTLPNGRTKTIHFGAAGMSDYTIHKDPERKQRYMARHAAHESWNNPMTAGSLSRWVLWNKTSLAASIADFKSKFRL